MKLFKIINDNNKNEFFKLKFSSLQFFFENNTPFDDILSPLFSLDPYYNSVLQ